MPSSPRTPRHSRHPSNIDLTFASPQSYQSHTHSRKASIQTPTTPNNRHSLTRSDSLNDPVFASGGAQPSNGLGNLADELADAWGDEEEEEYGDEVDMNFQSAEPEGGEVGEEVPTRDSGVDVSSSPVRDDKANGLSPPKETRGHRRQQSDYDGSDYGGDSDLESPGIPPGLAKRMDTVEGLARRGLENNGTERDGVVKRVIESLKDLGVQSGVEGGATRYVVISNIEEQILIWSRLITAHSALSTHIIHQTRQLQSLAYPLFLPASIPPDEDFINELLPLLLTVSESMPRPTTVAFNSLTQLHTSTVDVIQTLNSLSDSLYMSRQTTTTATRRLRSVTELVKEMRKEEDEREEGERWLKRHNWGERLGKRECAGVCGDVVGGFEEVCNGWRARLVAQAEAVS